MELIKIPQELLPVLRRWREDRSGLSYLAGAHIILLQEDLPTTETVFVLYHEAMHSRLFNCGLGFLITSLSGFEAQLAFTGNALFAAKLDESFLPNGGEPRSGFYSRRPRRPRELGAISPRLKSHLMELCRTERVQTLIRSYLEIRRRRAVLLNEWRLPHEGLATLSEVSILREMPRVNEDCALWAGVLGLDADDLGVEQSVRKRLEVFLRILEAPQTGLPSPDHLISNRGNGLDPYIDGASFLYHHLHNAPDGLSVVRVAQLASQIPYGILPGLDDPFDHFLTVAQNACSPTVRLGRLTAAIRAGAINGTAAEDLLPFALADGDRAAAAATQGYYSWEWKALHSTKFMDPELSLADKQAGLPYGLTKDQFLYNCEPFSNAGKVWVIYNDKAVLCDLDRNFGLSPVNHSENDHAALMKMIRMHFISQSFERIVENIVSWGGLTEEDGRPIEWV